MVSQVDTGVVNKTSNNTQNYVDQTNTEQWLLVNLFVFDIGNIEEWTEVANVLIDCVEKNTFENLYCCTQEAGIKNMQESLRVYFNTYFKRIKDSEDDHENPWYETKDTYESMRNMFVNILQDIAIENVVINDLYKKTFYLFIGSPAKNQKWKNKSKEAISAAQHRIQELYYLIMEKNAELINNAYAADDLVKDLQEEISKLELTKYILEVKLQIALMIPSAVTDN